MRASTKWMELDQMFVLGSIIWHRSLFYKYFSICGCLFFCLCVIPPKWPVAGILAVSSQPAMETKQLSTFTEEPCRTSKVRPVCNHGSSVTVLAGIWILYWWLVCDTKKPTTEMWLGSTSCLPGVEPPGDEWQNWRVLLMWQQWKTAPGLDGRKSVQVLPFFK